MARAAPPVVEPAEPQNGGGGDGDARRLLRIVPRERDGERRRLRQEVEEDVAGELRQQREQPEDGAPRRRERVHREAASRTRRSHRPLLEVDAAAAEAFEGAEGRIAYLERERRLVHRRERGERRDHGEGEAAGERGRPEPPDLAHREARLLDRALGALLDAHARRRGGRRRGGRGRGLHAVIVGRRRRASGRRATRGRARRRRTHGRRRARRAAARRRRRRRRVLLVQRLVVRELRRRSSLDTARHAVSQRVCRGLRRALGVRVLLRAGARRQCRCVRARPGAARPVEAIIRRGQWPSPGPDRVHAGDLPEA